MAKYRNTELTPEEYRDIQNQIDITHHVNSRAGVARSKMRLKTNFGVSSTKYKKKRKPKTTKPRIHNKDRYYDKYHWNQ